MAKKSNKTVGHVVRKKGHLYYVDGEGNVKEARMKNYKG